MSRSKDSDSLVALAGDSREALVRVDAVEEDVDLNTAHRLAVEPHIPTLKRVSGILAHWKWWAAGFVAACVVVGFLTSHSPKPSGSVAQDVDDGAVVA